MYEKKESVIEENDLSLSLDHVSVCVQPECGSTGRSVLSSVFYYSPGLPTVFTSPW